MRGLTRSDADSMTLGMWIDYIIEWNKINGRGESNREATQDDFDRF